MEMLQVTMQLTLMSQSLAFDFEKLVRSLPSDFPEGFRNKLLDLYSKHPEEFKEIKNEQKNISKRAKPEKPKYLKVQPATPAPQQLIVEFEFVQDTTVKPIATTKAITTTAKPQRNISILPSVYLLPIVKMPPLQLSDLPKDPTTSKPSTVRPVTTTEVVKTTIPVKILRKRENLRNIQTSVPPPVPMLPPIPYPLPIPVYPQMPYIVPMRTFYEPVIHNHPTYEKIKKLIKEDQKRWDRQSRQKVKKKPRHHSSSYTDSSSSSDYDRIQYYDDLMEIKGQ